MAPWKRLVIGLAVAATPVVVLADQARQAAKPSPVDLATARPGRDPNQPIDEAYTKKIKEYTTETFFLSPLVDYMPASKTVPTPTATLGDIAGAPGKLPYSKETHDYMRLLAKSSPRVKVYTIGQSEEGRDMLAVAVMILAARSGSSVGRLCPSTHATRTRPGGDFRASTYPNDRPRAH